MARQAFLFHFFFFGFLLNTSAQKKTSEVISDFDTLYIIDYTDQLAIHHVAFIKSNTLTHYDNSTNQSIEFKPNENLSTGLGISLKWLSLNLAINAPLLNRDEEEYGKTQSLDLQSNIYLRKFAVDLTYQKYEGYYISNPRDYLPDFSSSSEFPIRPDMKMTNLGASGVYLFNHKKFSYRAAFTQTERQIKSAGSWLTGLYFNYFEMNADFVLIPEELQENANLEADFRNTQFYNVGITGGYAYTFVLAHRIFISGSVTIGIGPQFEQAKETEYRDSFSDVTMEEFVSGRFALGYNAEKLFVVLSLLGNYSGEKEKNEAYLSRGSNWLKLSVGWRFDPPSWSGKIIH